VFLLFTDPTQSCTLGLGVTDLNLIKLGENNRTAQELKAIENFISKRNVRLFHFTSQRNLTGIAEHGLIPRTHSDFASLNNPRIPDPSRAVHGGTCVSIGWPNIAMMTNKKFNFLLPGESFVILEIDAHVLLKKNWFAFPTNSSGKEVSAALRKHPKAFSSSAALQVMFEDCAKTTIGTWAERTALELPDNLPTDPQAEIVFEDIIDKHWINSVFIQSHHQLQDLHSRRSDLLSKLEFVCAPEMFAPRTDNQFWRNGLRITYPIVVPSDGHA
jgi:hypothetical protein